MLEDIGDDNIVVVEFVLVVVEWVFLLFVCFCDKFEVRGSHGFEWELKNSESFVSEEFGIVWLCSLGFNNPFIDEPGDQDKENSKNVGEHIQKEWIF